MAIYDQAGGIDVDRDDCEACADRGCGVCQPRPVGVTRWPRCRCGHKRSNHAGGIDGGLVAKMCGVPGCECDWYRPKATEAK
jgi:hypothetical protein